jgi:twinkle protein
MLTKAKILRSHLSCPSCPSTDAYSEYDDGHGYCFSCKSLIWDEPTLPEYTTEFLPWRGVTRETMMFYNVPTKVNDEGRPIEIGFIYPGGSVKHRVIDEKKFYSTGSMGEETLFGMDKFQAGGKAITITEGELDALSSFQMLGSKYPNVSIRSSSSAGKDCGKVYDYLNSFEKIYLCLDNDEAGQRATQSIARLFDFNKVYHVKLTKHKDANTYLEEGDEADFRNAWYSAKRFLPEGIYSSLSDFDRIIAEDKRKPSVSYPFPTLQDRTYGIRTGEVVLFTALEGMGKTEIIRAIEYHLLKTTDTNIAIIHLEEDKARQIKGLAGYELGQPVHLPDSQVSDEELQKAIRNVIKRDDRVHLYSHFGSDDPNVLLGTIRFLVTVCGCKYVFFDHITMVVTGMESDDERKTLDYLSTQLNTMAHDLDFTLFLVSHENDNGQTRGSRNISKVAHTWVRLTRDHLNPDLEVRNRTHLTLIKNRFGSHTGPSGILRFDQDTFMITEFTPEAVHEEGLPL